jgi:hypothetical protein
MLITMEFPESVEEAFALDSEALSTDAQKAIARFPSLQGKLFE